MFFRSKIKSNSRNNSNKQSAKGGAIKNSTIEVKAGNDATTAIILQEVLKLNSKIDKMETKQHNLNKAFNHYVAHNGVKPEVKAEVKAMLEL